MIMLENERFYSTYELKLGDQSQAPS